MLADTESEKTKWVVALSELHRILKRNNLPNTTVSERDHAKGSQALSSPSHEPVNVADVPG